MSGFLDAFFGGGGGRGLNFDTAYFLHFVFEPSPIMLKGMMLTVIAAILSQIGGVLLGGALAVAGLSRSHLFRTVNQVYIFLFRGTPVLVQLVLIYFGLPYFLGGFDLFPPHIPLGPLMLSGALVAGIVTFILHEAAYMSEIIRAGILSIEEGQEEASKSLGMTPATTMLHIILPQAIRVIIPPLGNQFNQMLKTTSLLSVIAVPEMFRIAEEMQSATYKSFEVYLGVSVYYLFLTGVWTLIQMQIERRYGTRRGKTLAMGAAGA
ncbi:amino acid ABC transporter permease [Martelella sp. HB161492]|uniref:amino acid ABC transporter permease n=1 Tax=Martelella sp. HB161492 TaxID=2720726 RepID=UPI0015906804|nr:amino acid ABC transporter permease [Martelella sp. HB161492]